MENCLSSFTTSAKQLGKQSRDPGRSVRFGRCRGYRQLWIETNVVGHWLRSGEYANELHLVLGKVPVKRLEFAQRVLVVTGHDTQPVPLQKPYRRSGTRQEPEQIAGAVESGTRVGGDEVAVRVCEGALSWVKKNANRLFATCTLVNLILGVPETVVPHGVISPTTSRLIQGAS